MKRRRVIGWLLGLAVMVACTSHVETRHGTSLPADVSPELAAIDSLMWRQPDSALARLLPRLDTCCRDGVHTVSTTYDRHYAQVLAAELLYKNDQAQTNREELLQAVACFDSLTLALNDNPKPRKRHCGLDPQSPEHNDNIVFLDARAHYINGVGYYEQGDVVNACAEYLKALETMEERFEEKELVRDKARFMALTYTHLTVLFSDLYLHEQAIYFGKQALEYYQKHDATPWHIAWILNEIGSHYEIMEQFDRSALYYRKAIVSLNDTCCLLYRDVVSHQAVLEYKSGNPIEKSLALLKQARYLSQSDSEIMARCSSIGEIYYLEKQYDSALVYFYKVFHETQNEELKKQSAQLLVDILKTQGRTSEILDYADFLVPFANLNENQGSVKSQLTELYNGYRLRRTETMYQDRIDKSNKSINITVWLLFGFVSLVPVFYGLNRKRHRRLEARQEATEMLLESERYAHEMQQKALAAKLKKSNDSLRLQSEMVAKLQESMKKEEPCLPHGDYEALVLEAPCHEIMESLEGTNIKRISVPEDYSELSLSQHQLLGLAKATEKHYPGFEGYLRHLYPKISTLDLNICRLFLLGINEKQASILLHRDYSTIMEHVRKMKKALQIEENLRDFIKNG